MQNVDKNVEKVDPNQCLLACKKLLTVCKIPAFLLSTRHKLIEVLSY